MSVEACAEIVRAGDPDRFLSALTAPPELRGRLMVIYAFNLEIARAPWVSNEPMIAEIRLQFWTDVIAEIQLGKQPRKHEVAGPLAEVINSANIPCGLLSEMVHARRADISTEPHKDQNALLEYVCSSAGNLMWVAGLALGAPPESEPIFRDFGLSCGLANILVANHELSQRGHPVLPDPEASDISELAKLALDSMKSARNQRRKIPKRCRAALLAGWQADTLLTMILRNPELVAGNRLRLSSFSRRGRLLYRSFTGRW